MFCCNTCENKVISIFKGFGTKWNDEDLLTINFVSEIDLTGFKAQFLLGGIVKNYDDIADGFAINLTGQETGTLPIGQMTGTLVIIDRENNKKPFSTELPFLVKDWEGGDIKLDGFKLNINAKIQENDLVIRIETPDSGIVIERYVREQISIHNESEEAHPYIRNLISTEESRAKGAEGVLSELTTDSKTSLVSAINEINSTKVTGNTAITGDTKCKITYDSKGLVTGGTDLGPSDITTALGYIPYNSSNPNGYTSNVGTVTSVNNVEPVNGNVSLSIPAVNNATLTIQKNGSNVATFTANSSTNVTANISVPTNNNQLTNGAGYQTSSDVASAISVETTNRENADIGLQQQIDAITASSDVKDIVGTYAQLQAYDTSTLGNNDIIKVLQDETHDNETTYYRWSTTTETFTLIGEEGPYYTKSESDSTFVPQTRTVNNKALSSNITLTANDVGALPNSTTIPTDTSDLTNGAGFITSSALSGYATETWVGQQGFLTSTALTGYATQQWVGQQGYITGITSSDVTTALGYTPYNSTNPNGYITSSAISNMQTTTNLVTSVSSASTNTQYPSAKLFYDTCGDIETLINAL